MWEKTARVNKSAVVSPKSRGVSFGVANSFALWHRLIPGVAETNNNKKLLVCLHMEIAKKLTFYPDFHHEKQIVFVFNMGILSNPFHRHYS